MRLKGRCFTHLPIWESLVEQIAPAFNRGSARETLPNNLYSEIDLQEGSHNNLLDMYVTRTLPLLRHGFNPL